MVGALVGEGDAIEECLEGGWEGRRMKGRLLPLSVGQEMSEACACREKTDEKTKQDGQHRCWLGMPGIARPRKEQFGQQQ